ncbi:MAG: ATP-binding protein [Candidatus Sedimenticola sp. 20ELBAFRAG]
MSKHNGGRSVGPLRGNHEFQSSMLRLIAWGVMVGFIGLGGSSGFFPFTWDQFTLYFGAHFVWFTGLLVHVIWKPEPNRYRQYIGALSDVSGTSFCIYLSGNPVSPFFLIYIWSFISQGTRFGIQNLVFACIASIIGYTTVAVIMDGWQSNAFYINFLILGLIVLPLYQVMLLRKLHESRKSAEEANQARGNFLASMTHELRTPLSGVIGLSRLLGTTTLDREQREYVDSITSAGNVLEALVGDVLDFSKIDANKLELNPKVFGLRRCVVDTCRGMSASATDKGIELVCSFGQDVPEKVYLDELRIRQVLYNLIGNAIKFTHSGQVTIHVKMLRQAAHEGEGAQLEINVQDTGVGIPAEKQAEVFKSFWQADSSRTRKHGGTGLGTSISRDLIQLMGGSIGFESKEGEGTLFWVRIPCGPEKVMTPLTPPFELVGRTVAISEPHDESRSALVDACSQAGMQVLIMDGGETQQLNDAHSLINGNKVDLLLVADSLAQDDLQQRCVRMRSCFTGADGLISLAYPSRPVAAGDRELSINKPFNPADLWRCMAVLLGSDTDHLYSTETQTTGMLSRADSEHVCRVLVAEDDNINALLIQTLLTKAGHEVTRVIDGQRALDSALAGEFDLVLVDIRMPNMDGIEFTRAYRSQEKMGRRLPIIALTANATREMERECLAAGMDEFLVKPVDASRLDELLQQYAPVSRAVDGACAF